MQNIAPQSALCLHVEDLAGTAVAETEEACLELIVDIAKEVHMEFTVGLNLPFAPDTRAYCRLIPATCLLGSGQH